MACQQSGTGKNTTHLVQKVDNIQLHSLILACEQPYVVVNFYATDCKPCVREIPELIALQKEHSQEAQVIFVSLDKEKPDSQELKQQLSSFMDDLGYFSTSYYYNIDSAHKFIQQVYPDWNRSIPLNLIFANNGRLVDKTGITDKSELELIMNEDKSFFREEASP